LAGRSAGVFVTTASMMAVGAVFTLVYILAAGIPINWDPSGYWLIGLSGLGTAVATLMIFAALTRGPVSLASPTVASFPAISVPLSVLLGERPSLVQWLAMGTTMVGVWLVARAVQNQAGGGRPDYGRANIRGTILISIGAAFIFAFAVLAADVAIDQYHWSQTLLGSRLVGVFFFLLLIPFQRKELRPPPLRAIPLLLLIGLMDTGGHATLYAGLGLEHGQFAVVASTGYTVVTTIISRLFLGEPVSPAQWLGILIVVASVGYLSTTG
jgi:drug/metabolite transporter (DMT)-like permease